MQPTNAPAQSPYPTIAGVPMSSNAYANPSTPLSPQMIMQMQRTAGNRAIAQLMKSRSSSIQAVSQQKVKPDLQAMGLPIVEQSSAAPTQMKAEGDGVIQRETSSEQLQDMLSLMSTISTADRQEMLKDPAFLAGMRADGEFTPTQKTIIVATLLKGSMKWQNTDTRPSGPGVNTFGKHFDLGGDSKQLDEKQNPMSDLNESTMNCWESIMYSGYLAGAVDEKDIKSNLTDMDSIIEYLAGPARKLGSIEYSEFLNEEDKKLLEEYEDIYSDSPIFDEKTAEVNHALTAAMGRIEMDEEGKIITYGLPWNEFSHFTLSLGSNKVMSLNGQGQSINVTEAGDIAGIIPAWSNDEILDITDKIDTVEKAGLAAYTPPWEAAPQPREDEPASDSDTEADHKAAAPIDSTSTVEPTDSIASASGAAMAPAMTTLNSTEEVRQWVESMGTKYSKETALEQMGANTFDTWLATNFNVLLGPGAAAGLGYMI